MATSLNGYAFLKFGSNIVAFTTDAVPPDPNSSSRSKLSSRSSRYPGMKTGRLLELKEDACTVEGTPVEGLSI